MSSLNLSIDTPVEAQERLRASARARRIALGLTQSALASRSGVPLPTLKRFEQTGQVSLSGLLAIADALDALAGFSDLFPEIEAESLDDLERPAPRQRVRPRKTS